MVEYFLVNHGLVFLLEVMAAVAGTVYINSIKNPPHLNRIFVYYLWLVVFVEIVGFYPTYAYFTNYATLPFIEETPLVRNYWWYNIYNIFKFAFLFYFFIGQLKNKLVTRIFYILGCLFIFSAILNLILSDAFFYRYSSFTAIGGTLILVLLILIYYLEMLKSNKILHFYKSMVFYISIGLFIWHLIATPLAIYSKYFTLQSPDFVFLHSWILRIVNIFLYGIFIIGFLIAIKNRESLEVLDEL